MKLPIECDNVLYHTRKMRTRPTPTNHQFINPGKFALLTINNVRTDLPAESFQLSDGTWVLPGVPVPDLGIWKEWVGSIRTKRLNNANLVLLREEPSNNPEIVDQVHFRLEKELTTLFYMLHLRAGLEIAEGADLLSGSFHRSHPDIRQVHDMAVFLPSKGWKPMSVDRDWLEDALNLSGGVEVMDADKSQFRRVIRGLNALFNGLKETGQDRLHQFVRSLEALILPDEGKTKKQFIHRCQTFTRASEETRSLLWEAFDMRSDTEHLQPWERAIKHYPEGQREDICWHRTRQVEWLACDAYSRVLRDPTLREHFRTDDSMNDFWKLPDDQRQAIWVDPIDIRKEPLVRKYDQWDRAMA